MCSGGGATLVAIPFIVSAFVLVMVGNIPCSLFILICVSLDGFIIQLPLDEVTQQTTSSTIIKKGEIKCLNIY